MSRFWSSLSPCLLAAGGVWLPACFDEKSPPCEAGAVGCACLNLQCEPGLVCSNSVCVTADGTGADTSSLSSATSSETLSSSASSDVSSSDSASTSGSLCGNGQLDSGEECDGVPGCTDCQLDHWECNPLNNVPCPDGWKCSYSEWDGNPPSFTCQVFIDPPPGGLHDHNCFYINPNDQWCDVGLACITQAYAFACEEREESCCVEYCDLTDSTFVCADNRDVCRAFWNGTPEPGLNNLGFCGKK